MNSTTIAAAKTWLELAKPNTDRIKGLLLLTRGHRHHFIELNFTETDVFFSNLNGEELRFLEINNAIEFQR